MATKLTQEQIDYIVNDITERTNDPKWQEKGARPSKYKPEYCKKLLEYFNVEPYEVKTSIQGDYRWAADLPTVEHFATTIGISKGTYYNWAKKYDDFAEAVAIASQLQEHTLITNGLHGGYNAGTVSLIAKNKMNYVDKVETKNENTTKIVIIDSDDAEL